MWPCITLGLAGTLSLACEWWAWEIVGLVTSALGSTALAAQSVLLVSSSITYQLPFAMSVATAVRVGNLLGAGHAADARISAWVSLALSLLVGTANSLLFLVFRKQWGSMFSTDPQVVQLVARIVRMLLPNPPFPLPWTLISHNLASTHAYSFPSSRSSKSQTASAVSPVVSCAVQADKQLAQRST